MTAARRPSVLVVTALSVLLAVPPLVTAAPSASALALVDQVNEGYPIATRTGLGGPLAQTFVAGRTGWITRVDLGVTEVDGQTVQVRATDQDGVPTSTVLGSGTLADGEMWLQPAVLADPAPVEAGTTYAIVVDRGPVVLVPGDQYPEGEPFTAADVEAASWVPDRPDDDWDLRFRTYVDDGAPTLSGDLPDGRVGEPYDASVSATGLPAVTVTLADGALPDGLSLAPDGRVHGTPTASAAGSHTFTLRATSGAGEPAERELTVDVLQAPVVVGDLPAAVAGEDYAHRIEVRGFPAPTVAHVGGDLPGGLTLDATGLLSGRAPTTAGEHRFRVAATSAEGSDEAELVLTVRPGPPAVLDRLEGDGQEVEPAERFAPLSARVVDEHGNPVPGVDVRLSVRSGPATFDGGGSVTLRTDDDGVARVGSLLAGDEPGEVLVDAEAVVDGRAPGALAAASGLVTTYRLTVVAADPSPEEPDDPARAPHDDEDDRDGSPDGTLARTGAALDVLARLAVLLVALGVLARRLAPGRVVR